MLGAYTENGPYNWFYNETASDAEGRANFIYNNNSWNNEANVMFIDQPVGTGFSFSESIKDTRWNE
jgi:carboxypeptidase C (cathepsin A)